MSSILNKIGIFLTYRALKLSIFLFESNVLPDFITRWGMRRLLETNLVPKNVEVQREEFMKFVQNLKSLPIAINTADANEQVQFNSYMKFNYLLHHHFSFEILTNLGQHYELPPEFFFPIMGDRLKYSSCIFPPGVGDDDINAAEVAALLQVEQRAKLEDGLDILELGCGQIQ
jgi:cyclopropane-fatty-acyl-phospholipid synthase